MDLVRVPNTVAVARTRLRKGGAIGAGTSTSALGLVLVLEQAIVLALVSVLHPPS